MMNAISSLISNALLLYNALLILRALLAFFTPSEKWFQQPLLNLLYNITEPYMHWFYGIIPKILGMDFNLVLGVLVFQLLVGGIWALTRQITARRF